MVSSSFPCVEGKAELENCNQNVFQWPPICCVRSSGAQSFEEVIERGCCEEDDVLNMELVRPVPLVSLPNEGRVTPFKSPSDLLTFSAESTTGSEQGPIEAHADIPMETRPRAAAKRKASGSSIAGSDGDAMPLLDREVSGFDASDWSALVGWSAPIVTEEVRRLKAQDANSTTVLETTTLQNLESSQSHDRNLSDDAQPCQPPHPGQDPLTDVVSCQETVITADQPANDTAGFDGDWIRARICGTTLTWKSGALQELEQITPTEIRMRMGAAIYIGVLRPDGLLHWSDGDVWRRKVDSAEDSAAAVATTAAAVLANVENDEVAAGDETVATAPADAVHDTPRGDVASAARDPSWGTGTTRVLLAVSSESALADKLEEWCRACGIEVMTVIKVEAASDWRMQVRKAFAEVCEQSWPGDVCVLLLAGLRATEEEDEEKDSSAEGVDDTIPEGTDSSLLSALPMYSTLLCISDSRKSASLLGLEEASCADSGDLRFVLMLMCFDALRMLGPRRRVDFFTQVLTHVGQALSLADGPCSLPCKAVFEEMTDQALGLSAVRGLPAPHLELYAHPSMDVASVLRWPIAAAPYNVMSAKDSKAKKLAEKSAAALRLPIEGAGGEKPRPDLITINQSPRGKRHGSTRKRRSVSASPQNVPGNINELAFMLTGGVQQQRREKARTPLKKV